MRYALREAIAGFRRTPILLILSTVAIGFSLFVLGLFGLTAYNISRTIDQIEDRVELVAYLRDGASDTDVRALEAEVGARSEILDVRYISKAEALAAAVRELDEFRGVYSQLEVNPLPASLEIQLRKGSRTPSAIEAVAQRLGDSRIVEEVRFGRDWVEKIVLLRRVAGGAAAILGGAFALVAAVIIGSAIRIAVFARREEISIMRLVGATSGFIQRPFLLEGLFAGLIGSVLALGLTYGAFAFVNASLIRLTWFPPEWALLGTLAGAVFGLVASAASVRRHLRLV